MLFVGIKGVSLSLPPLRNLTFCLFDRRKKRLAYQLNCCYVSFFAFIVSQTLHLKKTGHKCNIFSEPKKSCFSFPKKYKNTSFLDKIRIGRISMRIFNLSSIRTSIFRLDKLLLGFCIFFLASVVVVVDAKTSYQG